MRKVLLVLVIFCVAACNIVMADTYQDSVRVGISDNSFSKLVYKTLTVGATEDYIVYDKVTNQDIAKLPSEKYLKVNFAPAGLSLYSDALIKGNIKDPIGFRTTSQGYLTVKGLNRSGKEALYRGEFEISVPMDSKFGFNLVNILPLQEYLYGVVPNEMPVSFGLEALKAQAIAARNYTLRPRGRAYHNFDVCDSVQSQVYFGANTEHSLATRAVDETNGLFALYEGKLILALYSSTPGGITEDYENVFLASNKEHKKVEAFPYLRGKPDVFMPRFRTEKDVEDFYCSSPESCDINSKFYRWEVSWDKTELENVLKKTLAQNVKSGFVTPDFRADDFGSLQEVKVISRGVSGKAVAVEIKTDKGDFLVKKELIIRKVFQKNSKMLNSANFVVKRQEDENGDLVSFTFVGGGYGHGVGMSQFGAGYMARLGHSFDEILQHYYTGISIGTFPQIIGNTAVTQNFYAPNGKGILIIENPKNVKNFTFRINDVEISLGDGASPLPKAIRLDRLINKDNNKIEYLPLQSGSVRVWVEVYRPQV